MTSENVARDGVHIGVKGGQYKMAQGYNTRGEQGAKRRSSRLNSELGSQLASYFVLCLADVSLNPSPKRI